LRGHELKVHVAKPGSLGLDELSCLGRVPEDEGPGLAPGNRPGAPEGIADVLGEILDAESLIRPRRHLHALEGLDGPGEAHGQAARILLAVQDGVEERAELADLERPLDGRRGIDLPVDLPTLDDPVHAEVARELDLAGRAGGEDVHVLRDADQIVGAVVEEPAHAHFIRRALRAGVLGEQDLGGAQPQRDEKGQNGGASRHPRHPAARMKSSSYTRSANRAPYFTSRHAHARALHGTISRTSMPRRSPLPMGRTRTKMKLGKVCMVTAPAPTWTWAEVT